MSEKSFVNFSEYRFSPKPTIMSGHLTSSENSSAIKPVIRRRIIEIHDSDSEEEIRKQSLKKVEPIVKPVEEPKVEATSSSNNVDTNTEKVPEKPPPESEEDKSAVIAEKELRVKYLIKMYPSEDSFTIYQALSEFKFDVVQAAKKLSVKHNKPPEVEFHIWKIDNPPTPASNTNTNRIYRSTDQNNVTKSVNANVTTTTINKTPVQNNHVVNSSVGSNSGKRKESSGDNKKAKKQKIAVDEDSNDSANGAYTDNRVYDSDDDSDVEISNELTKDKKSVLDFMQTATPNELQLMAFCSKKKVDALIANRPFKNWIDLIEKLQENKNLSTDLLNAAQQVLATRRNMKQLMKKCSNLAQKLEFAISNKATIKDQPQILSPNLILTSYQMVGLNWLAVLHNLDVNGILADEMGLGKTVQVIAFLGHLKEINAAKTTHLIVVPSSTLENWQNEFERWCPNLKVLLYYGSSEERRGLRMLFSGGKYKEYDVILTTYTMVSSNPEEKKMFRITQMHYVIFDEAHMLKNMNTQRYESLIRIKASKRILLTGTPLQNNLLELMSLLIFVMPNIFSEKAEDLKNLFQKTTRSKDANNDSLPPFERDQIEHAKRIMKPFVLRRLKKDVLQDLPKKEDHMLQVPMAPTQEEQYINLVTSFKEAGNNGNLNYNGVTMMSDLRKLSNHPLLLRYHYQYEDLPTLAKRLAADPGYKDTVEQYIIDDLACMSDFEIHTMTKEFTSLEEFSLPDNLILTSGKFLYLDKKLKELKEGGHRVLIFSQYVIVLDVMQEYLSLREHTFLRLDGSTPVPIRQQMIDEFNEDSNIFIFLLSTKAGGLGINLTAADTVIIHDIDFNPYNDKQAEDRCHRMGQQNPVSVYRLISKGTIEEGMWQLTQEKLKLEKEITSDDYENTDVKSVVNLLSSALGIDSEKATNLVSPKKKS